MSFPVAVHRWFERGEGWAFDSLSAQRCAPDPAGALNTIFDRQLKQPQPGAFTIPAAGGGVWVGWLEPDQGNLDRRVRPGDTPILRAALLPYAPDGAVEEATLQALRELSPRQPGEDPTLTFAVDLESSTPARRPRVPLRVPVHYPVVLAVLVLAAVAVVMRPWSLLRRGPVEPDSAHARLLLAQLQQWDAAPDGKTAGDDATVIKHFFAFLSQPAWASSLDASAHPYSAFVLRLPRSPLEVRDTSEAATADALARLLAHLGQEPSAEESLDELLQGLDRALRYERWWERTGKWRRYAQIDVRPARDLRDFVARFRRPAPEMTALAGRMLVLLNRWGERGFDRVDAAKHPEQVATGFFRLLSKQDFSDRQLALDHPETVFVRRLPREPIGDGRPLTLAELREALYQLLREHLEKGAESTAPLPDDVPRCLERAVKGMDFNFWLSTPGQGRRKYADATERIDGEVAEFVRRFR